MKVPVLKTSDYILYLEELPDCFVVHCDVLSKWTKEVKKKLEIDFKKLRDVCQRDICAIHTPNDNKHKKFLKIAGFTYLKTVQGIDGNNYDIYVWR